jgi:hypothetical protein
MSDQRYEFLAAAHEMIEAYLLFTHACHLRLSTGSTRPMRQSANRVTTVNRAMIPRRRIIGSTRSRQQLSDCSPWSLVSTGRLTIARFRTSEAGRGAEEPCLSTSCCETRRTYGRGSVGDMQEATAEQYSKTAEEIREAARRTRSPEVKDELFAFADRYDHLAEHAARRDSRPMRR